MVTKKDEIRVTPEKRIAMLSEKDYLVKLVLAALQKTKPKEAAYILEMEAVGLLNHYAQLESEIAFVERFNELVKSVTALSLEEKEGITKC